MFVSSKKNSLCYNFGEIFESIRLDSAFFRFNSTVTLAPPIEYFLNDWDEVTFPKSLRT